MTKFRAALVVVGLLAMASAVAAQESAPGVKFSKRRLFASPCEGAAVADLNKDGAPDVIYGAYWFSGPEFAPHPYRPNHLAAEYIHTNSDHPLDVDGDGWIDILSGAWGDEGLVWYKNPGSRASPTHEGWTMYDAWEPHVLTRTEGEMEMFALHDYDGDGVPEVHAACYERERPLTVYRFTKDAAGAPAVTAFTLGREGGGHGIAFGDVNGDGREDVLCEVGWYERPAGDLWAGPWKYHADTDLRKTHPSCPFAAKDLTGDGRLDLIYGRGHNFGLYWREQLEPAADGTPRWTEHLIDDSWSQAHCLTLADIDGDGSEDLLAGKCIWAHNAGDPGAADPPVIYYYTWDQPSRRWTRHEIAGPDEWIALGRQIAVADLNGDGRNDIVAPSKIGLWLLLNEGRQQ